MPLKKKGNIDRSFLDREQQAEESSVSGNFQNFKPKKRVAKEISAYLY